MANDVTGDIKYIDTAADVFTTAQPLGKIVWSGMSNTNELIIKTATGGMVIYRAKAALDNDYFEFDFNGRSSKMRVDTIGGGLLLIYPFMGI